jgi:hypothetical protein
MVWLNHSLTHTLAPNPSRHRKQPRAPPQPQPPLPRHYRSWASPARCLCPTTAARGLHLRAVVASRRLSPANSRASSTRALRPLSQLACSGGGARRGKLSIQSSTSSSSTDVEQHRRRMASSFAAPNLGQIVPLPLLTCMDCRLRFIWFKTRANSII